MIRGLLILGFLFSLVLFFPNSANADVKSDVLRLRLGMSKEAAHKILQKIGKLEKNESKQQEVWALSDNQQFSYIIIAFNKEYTEVRFITAKARENGKRVRYDEVLDIRRIRSGYCQKRHG
jgi:superfamily II DNA/RNA helicase